MCDGSQAIGPITPAEQAELDSLPSVDEIVEKTSASLLQKHPPRSRGVFNKRNSICGSANIDDLVTGEWWTDGGDEIYIHAKHKDGETSHRVFPRKMRGYKCKRMTMKDGKLYWLYDWSWHVL